MTIGCSSAPTRRILGDKVGIVTGASRGIGAHIARALAGAGAEVVFAARSQDALEILADDLSTLDVRTLAVPTDVTDPAEVEGLVARTVETFGRLDVAVNNAGGGLAGKTPVADNPDDDFRALLELNLAGVHWSMKHELSAMLASGGGAIVNMSSGSGHRASS